jgi:hypothetical protein
MVGSSLSRFATVSPAGPPPTTALCQLVVVSWLWIGNGFGAHQCSRSLLEGVSSKEGTARCAMKRVQATKETYRTTRLSVRYGLELLTNEVYFVVLLLNKSSDSGS